MTIQNGLDVKTLENWLWEAACKIRGPIDAPKYKDYILPLIFLKRLSDVFEDEINRLSEIYGSTEIVEKLLADDHNLVRFYLPPETRWESLDKQTTGIGEYLTDAVRKIAKENSKLQSVIDIVDFNATAGGQRIISDNLLKELIKWNQNFSQTVYENDPYNRFIFGFLPSSSSDWGWIQHMFASLKDNGKMAVVLDTGAVSRGSGNTGSNRERDIRKEFVEKDLVEAVILSPENLFYNTTAPGIILIINIEFKESWHDEYLKTVAAFANTEGGIIYIGRDDDGNAIGLQKTEIKKLLKDLPNKIRNKLGITSFLREEVHSGKSLLNIEIPPSSFPISYDGKFYVRTGSTTQELSGIELSSFLLEKTGNSWDELPADATINQLEEVLDKESIEKFIVLARQRLPLIEQDTTKSILQKLNLITKDGRLTRACILLFGRNPQKYFISAYSKVGRFKNNTIILDTVEVKGNLFRQLDGILEAIKKNINVRFDTSVRELSLEGVARREIWDYPLDALREAAINALVHRDYLDTSSSIEVRIYDDELILSNPGKLMPPLTIEQLKQKHSGRQRNPLIATVFYYANLIESWGSGTLKMISLCKKQNLPEPEFVERKEGLGQFAVVFHKDIFNEEELRKRGLNERQIKAVKYVKEKGKITNKEYQELSNISRQTATIDLSQLVKKGILTMKGKAGKGIAYQLTKLPNN